MTLGDKQRVFTKNIGIFIGWCYANGYELTFGEATRDPRVAELNAAAGTGILHTLHDKRLAIDLNLFKDGVLLTTKENYQPLGDAWKSLDILNCWGGDFSKPDSDHFSMTDGGVK
jgi:hypothetical protein